MPHIVLEDQQARIVSETGGRVEVRDREGRHLGFVTHGFTEAEIQEAKRRIASDEPRYSTAKVLQHLESLESQ
jgi:hypothetical protein